ncbi:hypothetical protein ACFPK9_10075 [Rubritalea spongiae]|uniref:Uncharacterized protein n=1 Tax=Rubritalea spongiae TaxID=430797 RepID=A0ABW5DZ56_9BACT
MRLKKPYRVSAHAEMLAVTSMRGRVAPNVLCIEENQAGGMERPRAEQDASPRFVQVPTIAIAMQDAEPSLTRLALNLHRM